MRSSAVPQFAVSVPKAILICAVSLFFAAAPSAFAQRGGGGGGGGHAGGGHASGGHASGGSHGGGSSSARGASASGARGAISASGAARSSSTRGYTRNTFVGSSGRNASASFLRVTDRAPLGTGQAFAANNYLWEDPPQQARPMMPMPAARPIVAAPVQPMRPILAPQVFHPIIPTSPMVRFNSLHATPMPHFRQPFTGPPFAGQAATPFHPALQPFFQPGFHPGAFPPPCFAMAQHCGFGSSFFFGTFGRPFGFGFGFGAPCFFADAFAPCAFGLDWAWGGGLFGYGYGNGWFYPPAEEPPPPPVNPTEDNPAPNYAPEYLFVPAPGEYPEASAQPQKPVVELILKDGTTFEVYSYWLQNNQLFYITTYNIKTSIPIDDLDLQKTVDANSKLGVTFSLSSKPPDPQQDQ
jgi:hypothetical protein